MTNKCKKCGETKDLIEFRIKRNSCKNCEKINAKIWQEANKQKVSDNAKKYYKNNSELRKEYSLNYRKENPEKAKSSVLKYYENNKQKIKDSAIKYRNKFPNKMLEYNVNYYKNNKEKERERVKKWSKENRSKINIRRNERLKTDNLFYFKTRIRKSVNYAFYKSGYTKRSRTFEILGCEYDFFKNYIEAQFKKGMTWNNIHLDHIKPISIAKTEKEVIELNHYTNFQPLFVKDNLIKSAKLITKQLRLI